MSNTESIELRIEVNPWKNGADQTIPPVDVFTLACIYDLHLGVDLRAPKFDVKIRAALPNYMHRIRREAFVIWLHRKRRITDFKFNEDPSTSR